MRYLPKETVGRELREAVLGSRPPNTSTGLGIEAIAKKKRDSFSGFPIYLLLWKQDDGFKLSKTSG